MSSIGPTVGLLRGGFTGYRFVADSSEPVVTVIFSLDFAEEPAGDNEFLPRTGWLARDYSGGGSSTSSSWHTYVDGSQQVLYCADVSSHLIRSVGTTGMEIEADVRLTSPGDSEIAGVVACVDSTDADDYISYEIGIDASNNIHVVTHRAGAVETTLWTETDAGLVEGDLHNLRLRVHQVDGVWTVTNWFDGLQKASVGLSEAQASIIGVNHTWGGPISFHGFNNFDNVVGRSVV